MHPRRMCEIDYTKRYLFNSLVLPLTLMTLVALTWKLANVEAKSDLEHRQQIAAKRSDFYFAFFLCCK